MRDTPIDILEALFEPLLLGAKYSVFLQDKVEALEDKAGASNIFTAALSTADLSIQTSVEVALLAKLPHIPFYGEEWKSSGNTPYLAGTTFVEHTPYLVTLDPIDGTRPYLDGHDLYQIILTVITKEAMEAALVLYPTYGEYVYALRGKGAFRGDFSTQLRQASSFKMKESPSRAYISEPFLRCKESLLSHFKEVFCSAEYRSDTPLHYMSSALHNQIQGAILDDLQIIDGSALTFVAKEMGYLVKHLDGADFFGSWSHVDRHLPGAIVAQNEQIFAILNDAAHAELKRKA